MHPYSLRLKKVVEQAANPAQAGPMQKYMRDQYLFLGIKTPQLVALQKGFYAQHGLPQPADLDGILRELWALPQREFQHVALGVVGRVNKEVPAAFIKTVEHMITTKSWWDTVDSIASNTVGLHFKRYPAVQEKYLQKWRKSENFWLRRTTILFQLGYKKETDFDLLCELIQENLGSKEFFINKAIGWALRQYARTDPKAVQKFVNATKDLSPLSRREALKHLGAPGR